MYKVSIIWRFIRQGWTESWFYNSNSPFSSALADAITQMVTARQNLNGKGVVLDAVRVIDVATPRAVHYLDVGTSATNNSDSTADQPNAAWLALATSAGGASKRQCWCRGIPDAWVAYSTTTGNWTPVGFLNTAFNRFKGVIVNSLWGLQVASKLNAAGTDTQQITTLTSTGGAAIMTVPAAPWAVTDSIIVSGFRKPLSYLNGTFSPKHWNKTGTDINTHTALTTQQAALYLGGASIRRRVMTFAQVADFGLERPGTRRTGKILFAQRGRQSVRR